MVDGTVGGFVVCGVGCHVFYGHCGIVREEWEGWKWDLCVRYVQSVVGCLCDCNVCGFVLCCLQWDVFPCMRPPEGMILLDLDSAANIGTVVCWVCLGFYRYRSGIRIVQFMKYHLWYMGRSSKGA